MENTKLTIAEAVEHLRNGGAIENDCENVELLNKVLSPLSKAKFQNETDGSSEFYIPDQDWGWDGYPATDLPTILLSRITDKSECTKEKSCRWIGDCDNMCLTYCFLKTCDSRGDDYFTIPDAKQSPTVDKGINESVEEAAKKYAQQFKTQASSEGLENIAGDFTAGWNACLQSQPNTSALGEWIKIESKDDLPIKIDERSYVRIRTAFTERLRNRLC